MVGNIASRRAGKSLLAIVTALLLPLLILGGLYARQAWQDITFIDKEITGLQLAERVYGALVNDKRDWTAKELQDIAALEKQFGKQGRLTFKDHVATSRDLDGGEDSGLAHSTKKDLAEKPIVDSATELPASHNDEYPVSRYLSDVGDVSGLIMDSDARSFHLINALIIQLPKAVVDYETLVRKFSGKVTGMSSMTVSAAEAQQMLGRVYASYDNLAESIQTANRNSAFASPEEYADYMNELIAIRGIALGTEMKLGQLTFTSNGLAATDKTILRQSMTNVRAAAKKSSEKGFMLLGKLIKDRRAAALRETLVFGSLGLACALLAMLLSIFMFRRTLVQLDRVTDLHEAAEISRLETEQINGEVAMLNRELSDKMHKLRQAQDEIVSKGRMEQLGQLTATIAHEIRNPLGAVRTSAFLLERKIAGKGLGVESQLQRINAGVVRCDNIITQLLDYSRNKQLVCTLGNLDEWMANTVREIAEKLPEAVYTECTLGLADKLVPFDSARLQRAVDNLMRNASEAMVGTGEDASKFAVVHPRIWVSTRIIGDEVVVTVKDNGPGITAENLHKVREPLFTTKSFGTGLGIPAIEQIAKQHGGHLEITSEVGSGATFSIYLPIEQKILEAA